MRNITVLSILVIIYFLIPGFCEAEENYSFSITPHLGFVYGQAFEYVYPIPYPEKGYTMGELLSELKWDMKPVFYTGIQLDFGRKNPTKKHGFFASVLFNYGIPGDSGTHENRDWMSVENNELTHFSHHTVNTNQFFRIDTDFGYSFPLSSVFYIKPLFNFSWMRFSFAGRNGYGKYARGKVYDSNGNPISNNYSNNLYFPIDDDPLYVSYNEMEVIKYKQDWFLVAAGFSVGAKISFFSIELSFKISPLTFCLAIDQHLTTKAKYNDNTRFGLYIEPKGNISFSFNSATISLEVAYRYIGKTRGETYSGKLDSRFVSLSTNKAGAGLSLLDTRLIFSWRF